MKFIIIIAILLSIGLTILTYKRKSDLKKLLLSFTLLATIISLGIVGNMMRSITPLFLTHMVAILMAYGGLIIYILRDKFYWYLSILPFATLGFYLLLSWLGNEHI